MAQGDSTHSLPSTPASPTPPVLPDSDQGSSGEHFLASDEPGVVGIRRSRGVRVPPILGWRGGTARRPRLGAEPAGGAERESSGALDQQLGRNLATDRAPAICMVDRADAGAIGGVRHGQLSPVGTSPARGLPFGNCYAGSAVSPASVRRVRAPLRGSALPPRKTKCRSDGTLSSNSQDGSWDRRRSRTVSASEPAGYHSPGRSPGYQSANSCLRLPSRSDIHAPLFREPRPERGPRPVASPSLGPGSARCGECSHRRLGSVSYRLRGAWRGGPR